MKQCKSIKNKLIRNSLLTLIPVVLINLAVGISFSYIGLEKNVERDLKSIGTTSQIAVSNTLNLMKEKIVSLASSEPAGKSQTASSWIGSLEQKGTAYGYRILYVADPSGKIISSNADYNGKNIADTEYFRQASEGKAYLSATAKDVNGQLAVFASAPVKNGSFSGVVVGEMDCQTYSNIIKNIVIGDTGNVFVIDKSGNMIANKRPQLVAQQQNFIKLSKTDSTYASSAAVYQKMIEGKSGIDTYAYETGTRICYYEPLTGTDGWSCGVVAPIAEMTSSIYSVAAGMGIASLILMILSIFLAIRSANKISAPIRNCSHRLVLLAKGDLHSEVPVVDACDETGDLAKATSILVNGLKEIVGDETGLLSELSHGNFNVTSECDDYKGDLKPIQTSIFQIIDSLNGALQQIHQSSEQVAIGAEQVSSGAQLLSQGTTEQAGSVEELSGTIKNLSDEIQKNADSTLHSNEKAEKVGTELFDSNRQMENLTNAMDKIHGAASKIGGIIKAIQDIAFQTNILALNAAVEAARAGESGKGFSVVADEVRNLAGKSAKASKETSELITEMTQAVEKGAKITADTGSTLLKVVDDAKEIISTLDQISGVTQNQAASIQQITKSMEQISSVIQTNSATAEESAAASEELSDQAETMKKLLAGFQFRAGDETD